MPGFAVGCPQRLAVQQGDSPRHSTSILGIAADPTGHYLAILTRHDLQVWSGGHHQLLLGWAATAWNDDLLEEDEAVYVKPGVTWSRSGQELCVLSLDGGVAFFQVHFLDHSPLIEGIPPPEWMDLTPGEGSSSVLEAPHAVEVLPLRRLDLGKGQRATCLSAGLWSQHLLLGKDRETAVLDISWGGHVQREYQLAPPVEGGGDAPSAAAPPILLHVCYSDVSHLLGAVLSDGRAIVSNIPSTSFSVKTVPVPPGVQSQGPDVLGVAESMAFSPVDAVLAVGYDDGSVAIFRVVSDNTYASSPGRRPRPSHSTSVGASSTTASSSFSSSSVSTEPLYPCGEAADISLVLSRRLSLASLGFEMRHVGAVMTMEYSPDGGSLAVAHSWGCSLNVWDTSQWCRPMTTFPRVPETPGEPVAAAVACLLWAQQGYRLLMAHNEVRQEQIELPLDNDDAAEEGKELDANTTDAPPPRRRRCHRRERASAFIVRYEMLKWARHAPMADTPLCLQGVNTLAFMEQRSWNPRLLSWAHVTIPPAYSVNVPVQLVAQSPSGEHLALAGRRGLALYNRPQRKWRLFGNVHQERDLEVAGLTWWGEDAIIVVAKSRQRTTFEMLIYPRHHLDNASLLNEPVTLPPGTRPLFLDCVKDRHGTAFRARSRGRVPSNGTNSSTRSPAPQDRRASLSTSGSSTRSSSVDASLGGVYWTESAVLMLGDANYLLFYRLARDHSPTGVSVSFLYDLQIPLHPTFGSHGGVASATPRTAAAPKTAFPPPGPVQTSGSGESPKRILLLPEVTPRAVAVLSTTGSLYQVEIRTGAASLVAKGVSSFWELCLPTDEASMRPCYVLYCGDHGFSLWLPSLKEEKALHLTREACQVPFLDPTFNPDVEGVMMGIHGPTSSLIFLTQSCIQPQASAEHASASGGAPIPPRFEVGLQRRPIYQVAFRFLLFLHRILSGKGDKKKSSDNPAAQAVAGVVAGVFDELYAQAETRIQLADALDFLVRSCIEAVATAHSRMKKKGVTVPRQQQQQPPEADAGHDSSFTSLATSTEQVKAALELCRREPGLNLFYEVIARVARKVEPSRQRYIFPLPDLDGQGYGDTPISLFEKCLASKKLYTALLYLPLIDPPASGGLGASAAGAAATPSSDHRARLAANQEELADLQLVHQLSLRLLWECLRRGKREWKMLKQLWRFIQKREDALTFHMQEARFLSHGDAGGGGGGGGMDTSTSGSGALMGLLYRATLGMLGAPSGAGGNGSSSAAGVESSAAAATALPAPNPNRPNAYLTHLPGTVASMAATRGPYTWISEGDLAVAAEKEGPASSSLADFDLLRHAGSGAEVVTLFASLCLSTLRLRELVDVLLLLGGGDPRKVPFPSLQPWVSRSAGDKKWQQHAWSSADWPWARFEAPAEVVLDSFLAVREQFASSSPSAAAVAEAAATAATGRKRACTVEERLSVLGRVCVELRDYECLLALGTFCKDTTTVTAALRRSKVRLAEYRSMFLDEGMEAGGMAVKTFVDKVTGALIAAATAQATSPTRR